MLGLIRQRARIRGELSRRIGYTNGLHDIFRFARVVTYLHDIGPASVTILRSAILEQEEAVRGTRYADGVIDVGRALGLLDKAGTKLTLSDKGYALHAVQQMNGPNESVSAMLLHSVLESDSDATLNLLDILSTDTSTSTALGQLLVDRLLHVLRLRETWADQHIKSKFVRDMVFQELTDSKRRLATAVDLDHKEAQSWSTYREEQGLSPKKKVERFYAHTVNPRRGWLKDLGFIQQQDREQYCITEKGYRLLSFLKQAPCYSESVFVMPFSVEVTQLLGLPASSNSRDLFWRATASCSANPPSPAHVSPDEHLQFIKGIYPHVKFHIFNEAAIEAIYNAMAAQLAIGGEYIERDSYDALLESTFVAFPDKIYQLRQRHGGSGYISMRRNAN